MQKRILIAPLVFLGLIAACSSSGSVGKPDNGDANGTDSGAGISLAPGTPGSCVEETCLCPDGQIGKVPCVEVKIFLARTPRQYKEMPERASQCECPPQRPDGGALDTRTPDVLVTLTPDATIPEQTVPETPQPDAAPPSVCEPYRTYPCGFVCPNGMRPEATCDGTGRGYIQHENAVDGVCLCPPNADAAIDAPVPQVTPDAKIAATPDALVKIDLAPQPDAFVPLTVTTPDASPKPDLGIDKTPDTYVPPVVVVTPDASPDLGPDLRPDTMPDITPIPDTELPIDTYTAPDLGPDLTVKRDCGCTEKDTQPDLPPSCWYGIPWTNDLTLTREECGGIEVKWQTPDCSKQGFKVVWISYRMTESGVDLPYYPNHMDGYEYLSDAHTNSTIISGLSSGTYTFRVCKYQGNGVCGEYSNPAFITVP